MLREFHKSDTVLHTAGSSALAKRNGTEGNEKGRERVKRNGIKKDNRFSVREERLSSSGKSQLAILKAVDGAEDSLDGRTVDVVLGAHAIDTAAAGAAQLDIGHSL